MSQTRTSEPHILLVEDEEDLSFALAFSLRREGMRVTTAPDLRSAREVLASDDLPDLVLLDLMLPDGSGLQLCQTIRASPKLRDLPTIMLTARSAEIDRVVGLEVGADDYVTKPFSVRELVLRVRAVLRRSTGGPPAALEAGRIRIDEAAHRVWVDEAEIELTALEYKLLVEFVRAEGRVLSRSQLIAAAWGDGGAPLGSHGGQPGEAPAAATRRGRRLHPHPPGPGLHVPRARGLTWSSNPRGERSPRSASECGAACS